MKKIVTIYNIDSIDELAKYSDGFIVSSELFGTRLTKSFSLDELNEIIEKANNLNKEIFINANQMFTDMQLKSFINNIKKLNISLITGIVVADIGAYRMLDKIGLTKKVVYNPETLLTNSYDFNDLSKYGILGAYLAKEITIEDIINIGENKKYKTFFVGHGHLNMFYSKRYLLDNYSELIEEENNFKYKQNLKITEPNRKKKPYPILEDNAGTHVFRSHVMNSFDYIKDLEKVVDYFIIDTIFKSDEYALDILKLYNKKEITNNDKKAIMDKYNELWDNGFLDTKTYYQRRGK